MYPKVGARPEASAAVATPTTSSRFENCRCKQLDNEKLAHFLLTNISCHHSTLESKVNTICEKVRTVLMQREQKKYIQAILSTYVRSTPSDLESALRLLAELKGKHGQFLQSRVIKVFCASLEGLILFSSSDGHCACWGSFKLHNIFVWCRPLIRCCFGNVRLQLSIDGCTAITKGKSILRTSLTSDLRLKLAEY